MPISPGTTTSPLILRTTPKVLSLPLIAWHPHTLQLTAPLFLLNLLLGAGLRRISGIRWSVPAWQVLGDAFCVLAEPKMLMILCACVAPPLLSLDSHLLSF
jgi:hypothetical protein